MTDQLCNALLDYNDLVDENETEFSSLLQTRKQLQQDLTVLNNDLSTLKNDLQIILDNIQVSKDAALSTVDLIVSRDKKQTEVNDKQTEVNNKNSEIKANDTDIQNLNNLISIENNLSAELLSELQDYIFEDEFSDDNQINDEDLYELGVKQLKKVCIPPINISLGIVNFFAILEEKHNWKRLAIGDIVRIKHDKLKIDVKATVNQLSFDFENNSIGITVANVKRPTSIQEKLSNALYVIDKVNTDYNKRKQNWDSLLTNFNLRNDRISAIPNQPVLSDSAITHKLNDNASVDLTLTWGYNDYNKTKNDADNIDGFIIYMYSDTVNNKYVFGSQIGNETTVPITQDKRSYTFPSVPPNRYYTFGVAAYRIVDDDISSDGRLFSSIVTPSVEKQYPYLPSETVVVNGNFNGKINGTSYITSVEEPTNPEVNNTVWTNPDTKQTQIYTENGWEPQVTAQAGNADTLGGKTYEDIVTETSNSLSTNGNYKGKYLSILGDSISTYTGWIPSGNAVFYNGTNYGVTNVNQTWWKRLIDQTGMNLCVNNSWSGSRVTTTVDSISAGCMTRATSLHNGTQNPDVIIVYLGINDFNNEVVMGSYNGSATFPTDTTTFREAYAIMLSKILTQYKNAEVYVCTLPDCERNGATTFPEINGNNVLLADWNKAIRELADLFGVAILEFSKGGLTFYNKDIYTADNLHPNSSGHRLLANKAIKTIDPKMMYSTLT
jgi:lysophospholipase L1-like esterase/outer membrane protein W